MKHFKYFLFLLWILGFSGCAENDLPKFCNVTSIKDIDWLNAELAANDYYKGSSIASIEDVLVYHAYYQK